MPDADTKSVYLKLLLGVYVTSFGFLSIYVTSWLADREEHQLVRFSISTRQTSTEMSPDEPRSAICNYNQSQKWRA